MTDENKVIDPKASEATPAETVVEETPTVDWEAWSADKAVASENEEGKKIITIWSWASDSGRWKRRWGGWGSDRKWWTRRKEKQQKEYDERLLEVRRVTRVTTGWRQLAFRAVILLWNRKGKIGLWVWKSSDVLWAIQKATHDAYKNIVEVPITWAESVPYEIAHKYKSSLIKLLPAGAGTWLKAWSSVRSVLELAGYSNILSKIVWTNNKLTNALSTIQALQSYKIG